MQTRTINKHLLFTYGTLMKDMMNHKRLDGATYLFDATTVDKFAMVANFIPYIIHPDQANKDLPLSHIHGEVYEITEPHLFQIDEFEGHPVLYKRVVTQIVSEKTLGSIPAFIYISAKKCDGTCVKDGKFKSYLQMRKNYSQYEMRKRK